VAEPRVPFKIAQPIDDVIYIMKRTNRRRHAVRIKAREGEYLISLNARPVKESDVEKALAGETIDLTQNLTIWYYLNDCTLKFKRYRGLDGKGKDCYRIVEISGPINHAELEKEQARMLSTSTLGPRAEIGKTE
jgi:hypothetical protein